MQLLLSHKSLSWWPISQRQAYPGCYLIRIVLLQALHGHFHFQKSFLLCASALIKPMVFFIWGEVREGSHFSGCQWETIFLKTSQWVHGVAFRFCQGRKRCCFVLPKALLQIKCEPRESRSLHFIISPSMPGGGGRGCDRRWREYSHLKGTGKALCISQSSWLRGARGGTPSHLTCTTQLGGCAGTETVRMW